MWQQPAFFRHYVQPTLYSQPSVSMWLVVERYLCTGCANSVLQGLAGTSPVCNAALVLCDQMTLEWHRNHRGSARLQARCCGGLAVLSAASNAASNTDAADPQTDYGTALY